MISSTNESRVLLPMVIWSLNRLVQVKLYSPLCGVTQLEIPRHKFEIQYHNSCNYVINKKKLYLFYEKTHLKYKNCTKTQNTVT